MSDTIDTLLLLALPASGKSEVRRYLAKLDTDVCARDFHLGPTVQLDDFPYVHMMRQTDNALRALGEAPVFFKSNEQPFEDPRDWGTLIELVNEDYADLKAKRRLEPNSAAELLMQRLDNARQKVGAGQPFAAFSDDLRRKLCDALEKEARELLNDKHDNYPDTLEGKTLVIEFARGGPQGAAMPLAKPFGYAHSVGLLAPEILENAAVLYVWVTPEESRRKNDARTDPNDPGSILHHGVPIEVMLNDYGCDDIAHLVEQSDQTGTVRIEAHGKVYHLPLARFDNRVDKTSFVRADAKDWAEADVKALHEGLAGALSSLAKG